MSPITPHSAQISSAADQMPLQAKAPSAQHTKALEILSFVCFLPHFFYAMSSALLPDSAPDAASYIKAPQQTGVKGAELLIPQVQPAQLKSQFLVNQSKKSFK